MSKWKRMKLSECCLSIADGDHQPPPKAETGIPFVTIANMTSTNQFDFSDTLFVPQDYYDGLDDKRKAKKADILYSVVGSFGIPVFMKEDKEFVFQRHIAILRPDREVIVPRFLFYTMLTRDFYAMADAAAIGAAQRTVSLTSLRNMEISIPDKTVQESIVQALSAYDDLIENNQRQIKLLEEAAKRLYKEWFVDLHFPGHEDIEIVDGVPKGWKKNNINGIVTFHRGYDLTRDNMIPGSYPVIGSTSIIGWHNEYKIMGPGIITGRSGSLGKYQLIWENYWPHNTSLYISDFKGHPILYVYGMLQLIDFSTLNNGGAIPTLNRNVLSVIPVIEPPSSLQERYSYHVQPFFNKMYLLEKENTSLSEARDRLLPKLMSGEIEL